MVAPIGQKLLLALAGRLEPLSEEQEGIVRHGRCRMCVRHNAGRCPASSEGVLWNVKTGAEGWHPPVGSYFWPWLYYIFIYCLYYGISYIKVL